MITEKSPSAKQIAKMAEEVGVKKLLLTHMRTHMDSKNNHFQMIQEMKENFSGESGIAEDLMKIEL